MMAIQRTMAQAMANFCWDLPFLHKQQTQFLGSGVTSVLAKDDSRVMSVRSTENLKIKFMHVHTSKNMNKSLTPVNGYILFARF